MILLLQASPWVRRKSPGVHERGASPGSYDSTAFGSTGSNGWSCPMPPASTCLGADLQLAERCALVGPRLLRQAEHALTDDVLLHLVAAAVDRDRRREQCHLLEHAVVG